MTRRAAPNRFDAIVDANGKPNLRFIAAIEDLVDDVNDLMTLPINTQDSDYTLVLEDAGQIIRNTGSAGPQYTIADNDSVAFDTGSAFEVQNDGSTPLTVKILTDTLTFEADNTTGTRTIAAGGSGLFRKVAATAWKCRGEQMT